MLALTVLLLVEWIVDDNRPRRNREVVQELSQPRGRARLFLVVGTDSRQLPHLVGDRFGRHGAITTEWADVVMLVGLHPQSQTLKILSLPREMLVDVDGGQKLGAALESGGPRAVVRAVRRLTGLQPNHYLQLDFLAFERLVDRLGGVTLEVSARARDLMTGLELRGGRQRLSGAAALAYVRSRSYEEWREGIWTPLDDGDLGRIQRQHHLLRAIAADREASPSLKGLWAARDLAGHVVVDARLSLRDMGSLARSLAFLQLGAEDLQTLPTAPLLADEDMVSPFPPHHVGAVAYLVPAEPQAAEAIANIAEVAR